MMRNPFRPTRQGEVRPAADSGMVTMYQPAQHRKPQQSGLIARLQRVFMRALGRPDPSRTTELGSAGAASPSTYAYSLYSLRYERRALIEDCRDIYANEPRARRAVNMYAREAVRKGCTIVVNTKGRGRTGAHATVAKQVADAVQALVNPKVQSWSRMLLVEGELFLQAVVCGDDIVAAKRMPASSMERNTNDADEFVDPARAFSQVDVISNQEVATFPLALMHHQRWNWIDGERYGEPEIMAIRRMRGLLQLAEEAQIRRRMARAPLRRVHSVGDSKNPSDWSAVEQYKEKNGFVEGQREMWDPVEVGRDYFNNGLCSVTNLEGDQHVHEIADLKYYQNVYSVDLPTPAPLYNLDAEAVNRDVLDDLRGEWLKSTVACSDAIAECIHFLMRLGLLLRGVLPETVDYTIRFSESSIETPSDIIGRVLSVRQATIGQGRNSQPDPLISRERAIQTIAEFFDISDVDAEEKLIETEREYVTEQALETQKRESEVEAESRGPVQAPLGLGGGQQSAPQPMTTVQPMTPAARNGSSNGRH